MNLYYVEDLNKKTFIKDDVDYAVVVKDLPYM